MNKLRTVNGYHPIFNFIYAYVGDDENMPDGLWHQLHVNAVERYNEAEGTDYDFFDFQFDYFTWLQVKEVK